MTEDEYIKKRVDDQINWYSKKSTKNKTYHILTKISEILSSSFILLLINIDDFIYKKYIISFLAFIISVSSSISYLLKFHEKWINYRTTAESLKHEKYLYETKCYPYDDENSFCLFVQNIESIISKENSYWKRIATKK